jgi:hypothetical protein
VNDDNGKKLLIGGGLVALGAIILNQIYTSGFQAGLLAAGAEPGTWHRYGGGGFPFGFFILIGIGVFIWYKVTNGGKRGPGGWFSGHRRGFFDDRRQPWSHQWPQQYQQQPGQPYGAPQQQQPYNSQAPGAAPQQPPVNYGPQGNPQQPPVSYSPPTSPAPGHPQPEPGQQTAPPAASDPNKPAN